MLRCHPQRHCCQPAQHVREKGGADQSRAGQVRTRQVWFLCGFGYFLDLAWAQGVGLIATAVYQEMGVADADTGNIFAIANAGLAIGALGFGLAVDVIGRKWAFNLTYLITSVFGLLLVPDGARCMYSSFQTRANVLLCHRLLRSTTTAQSVASTFWPRLDLGAISQSMLPSLSSFCPRTVASWSRFFPCGNPSALRWLPASLTGPLRSGVATLNCPRVGR